MTLCSHKNPDADFAARSADPHFCSVGSVKSIKIVSRQGMATLAGFLFGIMATTFRRAIGHIVFLRSWHQVLGIKANRIIAGMTNGAFTTEGNAMPKQRGDAMDSNNVIPEESDGSVSARFSMRPLPAFAHVAIVSLKINIIALFLCASACFAQMPMGGVTANASGSPAAVVKSTCAHNAFGTSSSCTLTPFATGDVIAVEASEVDGTVAIVVATSGGCAGTPTTIVSTTTTTAQVWAVIVATSTSTCTVSMSWTGSSAYANVFGWDIANCSTTADGSPTALTSFASDTSRGTSYNSPSVTTTVSGDVILSVTIAGGGAAQTAATPFTQGANSTSGGGYLTGSYYIQPSSGAISPGWTQGTSNATATATLALEP